MTARSPTLVASLLAVVLAACTSGSTAPTEPDEPPTASDEAPASTNPAMASPQRATPTAEPDHRMDPPTRSGSPQPTPEADALLAVQLTDVRDGEVFSLAELAADEGPVLLEPMAVWCTSCLSQQREVVAAHENGAFASVSLDVDLSEAPEDLAAYADREGFDWRFAMADASLYRLLQERFGIGVTNPPSTPLIVIERDGTVRPLEFGVGIRSAERLLDELGAS